MKCNSIFLTTLLVASIISCKKSKDSPSPVISSITPDNGVWSTIVTINGNNFSTNLSDNTVQFNGKDAQVISATGTVITAEVPKGAGTGPVSLKVGGKTVTGPVFNYTYITRVNTLAGSTTGFTDGAGTTAQFASPMHLCIDAQGNIYVADPGNYKVRKVTPAGVVSTLAGSTSGHADGAGTAAQFKSPWGICIDALGNIYVADVNDYKIRKITPAGVVTTLAGSTQGHADGTGAAAQFHTPVGICVDAQGNLYVTDEGSHKIRKVTPAGIVTTIAGSTAGYADGTGSAAQFNYPRGICIDAQGNLLAVEGGHKIRKITPAGIVTTIAGSTAGYADGTGSAAQFNGPCGITLDPQGNMYVTEFSNHKIRKITPAGVVSTVAGSTSGFADGNFAGAKFASPYGICLDAQGSIYVADRYNYKIRKIFTE
jgi:sugar lactone lactonase YvrE